MVVATVSRQAIAAALAREDLAGGERLVAFSLASFAGRDDRAWPGAPAAAARAGLSRSRYLHDRDRLVAAWLARRRGGGVGARAGEHCRAAVRGGGPVVGGGDQRGAVRGCPVAHAQARARAAAARGDGGARRPDGVVRGLSSEELCAAAGVADRTYRRARRELLESGELALVSGAGGRGNTNVWQVRASAETPVAGRAGSPRRVMLRMVRGRCSPAASAGDLAAATRPDAGGSSELGSGAAAGGEPSWSDRCFGRKGRSGQDGFGAELSCLVRGFRG